MTQKERLYETLGELLYVVAKADGVVQSDEKAAFKQLMANHGFAAEIEWSFDYEEGQDPDIEDLYKKVISFCHAYGPAPEYQEFIDAMKSIAEASDGIDSNESRIIESFSKDLIERFQRDLDRK